MRLTRATRAMRCGCAARAGLGACCRGAAQPAAATPRSGSATVVAAASRRAKRRCARRVQRCSVRWLDGGVRRRHHCEGLHGRALCCAVARDAHALLVQGGEGCVRPARGQAAALAAVLALATIDSRASLAATFSGRRFGRIHARARSSLPSIKSEHHRASDLQLARRKPAAVGDAPPTGAAVTAQSSAQSSEGWVGSARPASANGVPEHLRRLRHVVR